MYIWKYYEIYKYIKKWYKFKNYKVESIVKGDTLYYSIAAASIIAKEYHDMHINELITIDCLSKIVINL